MSRRIAMIVFVDLDQTDRMGTPEKALESVEGLFRVTIPGYKPRAYLTMEDARISGERGEILRD